MRTPTTPGGPDCATVGGSGVLNLRALKGPRGLKQRRLRCREHGLPVLKQTQTLPPKRRGRPNRYVCRPFRTVNPAKKVPYRQLTG
jgi:hypothetical protein